VRACVASRLCVSAQVTFLSIPRTYYGLLEADHLVSGGVDGEFLGGAPSGLSEDDALEVVSRATDTAPTDPSAFVHSAPPRSLHHLRVPQVVSALRAAGLVDGAGALSLDADAAELEDALADGSPAYAAASAPTREMVQAVLRRSRYVNLWPLLGEQLDEGEYLRLVRNQILIDVQGEDVLMQVRARAPCARARASTRARARRASS
jgi:hypothetical protein